MKKAKHARLSGVRKAVLLLTLIGKSYTPKIFVHLSPEERKKLLAEKKRMGKTSSSEKLAVLKEFISSMKGIKPSPKPLDLGLTLVFTLAILIILLIYLTQYKATGLTPLTHFIDIGGIYFLIFPVLVYLSPQYFGDRFSRITFQSKQRAIDTYYAIGGAALLFALMTLNTYVTQPGFQTKEKGIYLLILFLVAGFFAPVIEEFFFRKVIHDYIKSKGSLYLGATGSSLAFALVHPPFNPISFITYFLAGMILISLYEKRRNLYTPILAHSTGNILILIVETFI